VYQRRREPKRRRRGEGRRGSKREEEVAAQPWRDGWRRGSAANRSRGAATRETWGAASRGRWGAASRGSWGAVGAGTDDGGGERGPRGSCGGGGQPGHIDDGRAVPGRRRRRPCGVGSTTAARSRVDGRARVRSACAGRARVARELGRRRLAGSTPTTVGAGAQRVRGRAPAAALGGSREGGGGRLREGRRRLGKPRMPEGRVAAAGWERRVT
jgi:hypothetical protein